MHLLWLRSISPCRQSALPTCPALHGHGSEKDPELYLTGLKDTGPGHAGDT